MRKRYVSLFVALFICAIIPLLLLSTAKADTKDGRCGADLTWSFNSSTGTLTIQGTGPMYKYENRIYVPWFQIRSKITSVVLPEGMTNIGNYAFYDLTELTEIIIPDSITSIGEEAFEGCNRLRSSTKG